MPRQQVAARVKLPFGQALRMLGPYARSKVLEQVKTVSLIVAYLVLFQTLFVGT